MQLGTTYRGLDDTHGQPRCEAGGSDELGLRLVLPVVLSQARYAWQRHDIGKCAEQVLQVDPPAAGATVPGQLSLDRDRVAAACTDRRSPRVRHQAIQQAAASKNVRTDVSSCSPSNAW